MFSIANSRARDPSCYFSRRARAPALIVGAAAVALLASAHTFARAAENSTRMAREHHACAVVMGLHQLGDLYDTCIRSLNKSLSELEQTRSAQSDQSACAQSGRLPGTRAFAVCVVTAEQSPADAVRYQAMIPVR
jgi:hypothetical protein